MLESVIYEEVLLTADHFVKVKAFLHMIVVRARYLKLKQSTALIKRAFKKYRYRKDLIEKISQIRDAEYLKLLKEEVLALKDPDLLN